jgi:hypothetical protein
MDERVTVDEKNVQSKAKIPSAERISIKPIHLRKLDAWVQQVSNKHRGVRLARNDVLAWLIEAQSEVLSPAQETTLARMFYDEERFLRETLEQLKKCKGQGIDFDWYSELMKRKPNKSRKHRKKKGEITERTSEKK